MLQVVDQKNSDKGKEAGWARELKGVGPREGEGGEVPRGSTLPVRLALQDLYIPRQARMVTFRMVYAPSPTNSHCTLSIQSAGFDMPCMIV